MDNFGIAPAIAKRLREIFDHTPAIDRVWIYGSRARGDQRENSDIDLAVDAPEVGASEFARLWAAIQDAGLIYQIDVTHWQTVGNADFRARIEHDRKLFWQPRRHAATPEEIGVTQLKPFQATVLTKLDGYLAELKKHALDSARGAKALRAADVAVPEELADFPRKTWEMLKATGELPPTFAKQPHSSRFDGAQRAIPNVCLKVPTGGGKTLLAAASIGRVFSSYLNRHAGLVLWIVPNEAIYRQTLKTLTDRDHPYRQMLNVAGAGRVRILEKNSPLTRLDVDSYLCVMLLMLQSAARKDEAQKKLKAFRDRGNVLGFVPREDDIEAHWRLLGEVPNLDVYAPFGQASEAARKQKGSIVKSSLGNVLRLMRPMVVIDEGHHAYTENALRTLDGFNPCFMLELSATPRVSSDKGSGSNILVDVRGTDLDEAEMIKLPIHVDVRHWTDWQSCLASGMERLDTLQREAEELQAQTNRYIRPLLLVQVERTGKDMRDTGFIHAEDAKAYLMQLGLAENQIAIKTSDKDELKQPENIDLLSATCGIRAIITKQALQEGWDCPFAYVLCALAAGRQVNAMTQLVGRILRQPQVAKTGRAALDSCYVLCHNAKTGEVVRAIKQSLESEGMGDLGLSVTNEGGEVAELRRMKFNRRERFARASIFLPRVTWVEPVGERRELAYESDVLAQVDWAALNVARLASRLVNEWAPSPQGALAQQFDVGLDVLSSPERVATAAFRLTEATLDRARLVRGLLDIAPNAWWSWSWVDVVVQRLQQHGYAESLLAASSSSLLERLRVDIEAERDRLAQDVFDSHVAAGRIEFRLRADATDFKLPTEFSLELSGKAQTLSRDDGRPIEKSLFEPALAALVDSGFEADVACYLDSQAALIWWHRNVAKSQYGLQGWKRHKVYPDFVFAKIETGASATERTRLVVLETKGMHLAGSNDTNYKQSLLQRLSDAFRDERISRPGELELVHKETTQLVCDLVFDTAWKGRLQNRHFNALNG